MYVKLVYSKFWILLIFFMKMWSNMPKPTIENFKIFEMSQYCLVPQDTKYFIQWSILRRYKYIILLPEFFILHKSENWWSYGFFSEDRRKLLKIMWNICIFLQNLSFVGFVELLRESGLKKLHFLIIITLRWTFIEVKNYKRKE